MKRMKQVRAMQIAGVALTIPLLGCSGGNDGPPATLAAAHLTLKDGIVGDPTIECNARVIWRLNPVDLTGTDGQSTPVTVDRRYEDVEPSLDGTEWRCFYRELVPGLRPGTWHVSSQTSGQTSECEEELGVGNTALNFTSGFAGCRRGSGFPGD